MNHDRTRDVLIRISRIRENFLKHLASPGVGLELLDAGEFHELYELLPALVDRVDLPADDPGAQRFFMEHFVRVLDDAANLLRKSCLQ